MLSLSPLDLSKFPQKDRDREILRLGMMAELDATSLYEQLAAMTTSKRIKNILLDIAKEEKTHTGEFQALLLEIDKEQAEENKAGAKEVAEKA
jgi:rubrerythrin